MTHHRPGLARVGLKRGVELFEKKAERRQTLISFDTTEELKGHAERLDQ